MSGRGRGKSQNPWTVSSKGRPSETAKKSGGGNGCNAKNGNPTIDSVEQRFERERQKLQASVKKHVNETKYDSSEEEEEDTAVFSKVFESVINNYCQVGGGDLGKTQTFLENSFQAGAGICLICISHVKKADAVWNCQECFGSFHMNCIQKWSRDSIFHQKQALEELPVFRRTVSVTWGCPKCRFAYSEQKEWRYFCFCEKAENPSQHPWLIPHSCGETCDKPIQPECGHKCLLLCHPGPCPPCPKMVKMSCHCSKSNPVPRRCSDKLWSCHKPCKQLLKCKKHECGDTCHLGECSPCPRQSMQTCDCGGKTVLRACSVPSWKCDKVCGKPFSCGHHSCDIVCHAGPCGDCPLSQMRTCPCGKTYVEIACTAEVPTCNDTCNKLMECGVHRCQLKCHKDKCACLEIIEKVCRCGLHKKEIPCIKEYLCGTKCKKFKSCMRHPCNRKCCDGVCPPCEKPCGRTLPCGTHKCPSICHRGACFPCQVIASVSCRCGSTAISVPCGRERRTKPPRCKYQCKIVSECKHPTREAHRCHFGMCPPCRQTCGKPRNSCQHPCLAPCHSAVWLKREDERRPAGPWEVFEPEYTRTDLPCEPCTVPMLVACLGLHEQSNWPCGQATPSSCGRPCGRQLQCGNHKCSLPCHAVEEAPDEKSCGVNCQACEGECLKPRPTGCTHRCKRPCHAEDCSPCLINTKIKCHCGIVTLYASCCDLTTTDSKKKEDILSCGNPCPNSYPCGHKCRGNCHLGPCPDADNCRRKVKLACKCGRLKKDMTCDIVRKGGGKLDCDSACEAKQEDMRKVKEAELRKKKEEEDKKNKEELAKFEKKFAGKKKERERRKYIEEEKQSVFSKYWWMALLLAGAASSVSFYFIFQ